MRPTAEDTVSIFPPRSILFTTAHLAPLLHKAAASAADAVCLDLEDGVPADRKREARKSLQDGIALLRRSGKLGFIRINSELEHVAFDLETVPPECTAVVLPKTQGMQHVESLAESLDRLFGTSPETSYQNNNASSRYEGPGIVAMFETASAIQSIAQDNTIRAHKRLLALTIGTEDLAADMSCQPGAGLIMHAFDQLSMCATRLGVALIGYPDSIAEYKQLNTFETGVQRGQRSGAVGGFCIHPAQIDVLNRVFKPGEHEVDWARRVVAAYEAFGSTGTTSIDGQMIDPPVYKRARQLMTRAGLSTAASLASNQ